MGMVDTIREKLTPRTDNLTHSLEPGAMLNTALNPLARFTGKYYAPEFMSKFPTKSDPYFNAALFQAGAVGVSYAALAGLTRYVMGLSEQEKKKAAADKLVKDRLGVEEEEVSVKEPGIPKTAASYTGDFLSLAIPMAALAVGVSGGYAVASRKLSDDRGKELDADIKQAEEKLKAARGQAIDEGIPKQALLEGNLPSGSFMLGLAGLALASIYDTSAFAAKKQFDSTDEARVAQKATDEAFKALTRSRVSAADTDLHYVDKARSAKRLALPKEPLALPEAPKPAAPQETVRPYESVPV